MNFKTKIVVSIFSLFLTISNLKAQSIQSLLNEVSNKVKSYENIQIDFKYSLENTRENVKQDTRANITLKGDNYVLNMLGVTRIFDGKTIYTIVPEDEEVTISNYSKEEDKSNEELGRLKDSFTNSINTMSTSFNTLSKDVTRDMTQALTKVDEKVGTFNQQVQ